MEISGSTISCSNWTKGGDWRMFFLDRSKARSLRFSKFDGSPRSLASLKILGGLDLARLLRSLTWPHLFLGLDMGRRGPKLVVQTFFDPFQYAYDFKRNLIEQSWPHIFLDCIGIFRSHAIWLV
uniref:Uncharacterized protein n=1 Tax=Megaselia scalaris TaxID=36166 RepID=T1GJS9_MEGSC